MPKIVVENLYKFFGGDSRKAFKLLEEGKSKEEILKKARTTVAINNASFSVEEGSIFVIMGLSGSGKSTMIRCINRLIEPTRGRILLDNEDLTKMDKNKLLQVRRKKLGMIFQNFAIFPHRTIINNVAYGLEIQGVEKEKRFKKAEESLELVGLKEYKDSYPNQLSGGMKQRVGLARALAIEPDILLMDEPFSALDPLIRKDMQDELLDLQSSMNKTIVFITHDLDEALKLGDKIALMKDGEIVQIGTSEEILMNPANDYVAKFVEDVDMSKVLKAEDVMIKPVQLSYDTEGPRVALRKMKESQISSIFVVDRKRKLKGILSSDSAAKAIKDGITEIKSIMGTDFKQVPPDKPINEITSMIADINVPIAVIEDEKIIGVLIKGVILAGLAGREDLVYNGNDK